MAANAHAWAGENEAKWGGHIDLEGKAGTDRHLGEADLFLPVVQDDDTLLFASIRTRLDDEGGREGNFGLGLRHMLDDGWNLGGYGYFDRRRSGQGNYFSQVTIGAELLGRDWDVRANAYIPVGTTHHQVESLNTAELSGTSVIFRGGEEHSLGGFDGEIGWRLPLFDAESGTNLRLYGGGYRFSADADTVPDVSGPRGRLDLSFDEVPYLWDGSRLSLGAEVQHDDPRGTQGFLTARLRIPLQADTPLSRLTQQERRMTDPIVRDIDIVSQAGTFGPAETASQLADGQPFTVVNSASTTTAAALNTALATAGANSTVLLSGSFSTNAQINLQIGQTVKSGSISVRSASGRVANVATQAAITTQAGAAIFSITMADGSTVSGLTVSNTAAGAGAVYAIRAQSQSDVTITGNTLIVSGANQGAIAVDIVTTTGAVVNNNTIQSSATTVGAVGIEAAGATGLSVSNNSISAAGVVSYAFNADGATALNAASSTGNILVSGTCHGGPFASGSVSFTNGTVCQ
ncbi:inverse autotransporter beta domain-containing protein [Magnetospirillum sulfuroxidans]|uniref:Inverse autotransporter beta domain-containing protein n=1 Tax=Magnetospirillum sulfuroxidans TaxID=611300 RepID=A0ABS5I847_9PROT|nr:inverse autotransporter beta domain-containing protein [Magnetospirillum sulfuroxidans]MBR9970607.1 inverse autotransporter beta domain-containing protein [Magnetospirillum sulfuroxidans]